MKKLAEGKYLGIEYEIRCMNMLVDYVKSVNSTDTDQYMKTALEGVIYLSGEQLQKLGCLKSEDNIQNVYHILDMDFNYYYSDDYASYVFDLSPESHTIDYIKKCFNTIDELFHIMNLAN